jgi:hypothetical protein
MKPWYIVITILGGIAIAAILGLGAFLVSPHRPDSEEDLCEEMHHIVKDLRMDETAGTLCKHNTSIWLPVRYIVPIMEIARKCVVREKNSASSLLIWPPETSFDTAVQGLSVEARQRCLEEMRHSTW